jgi:nicotinate-nucleotide adenylyltransferase
LGGAFDPPHGGHLKLALLAFERLNLDELRFVPVGSSPQKGRPIAPPKARLAMLGAMLAGTPFAIETVEIESDRAAPNYTVDTLEEITRREPGAAWILAMGMDQAINFGNWREPARILGLASLAVAPRPGRRVASTTASPTAATTAAAETGRVLPAVLSSRLSGEWSGAPGQVVLLPSTDTDLSSSALRERAAAWKTSDRANLDGLPEKIRDVISENNLYS